MKRILLFFTLIFFFNLSSVGQDYDYCECLEYYRKSKSKEYSFIELRSAIQSEQIKAITYKILNDSVFKLKTDSSDTKKSLFVPNLNTDSKTHQSPQIGFAMSEDTSMITSSFTAYLDSFPNEYDNIRFVWGYYKHFKIHDVHKAVYSLYAISTKNDNANYLAESAIDDAYESIDPHNGNRGLQITMTNDGANQFEDMSSKNVGEFLAILSENKVLSAPVINAPVPDGSIYVDGKFSKTDASDLKWLINCKNIEQRLGSKVFKTKMEDCK